MAANMDQTQQKALNALEPFILLSKSANSPRAAADLVTQATSAPNTFVFAELLQTPNIQSLQTASEEYARYLTLLQIFAWGTWSDYTANLNLPKLTLPQETKLRQLSLLSLCTSPTNLTYVHLLSALDLPTVRALEDLVISTIYSGLLNAKLDTLSQRVDVSSVAPLRDLKPGSIPTMVSTFEDWDSRCVSVLADLEDQIREVKRKASNQRQRQAAHDLAVMKAMGEGGEGKGKGQLGKRGGGQEEGEEMDVDQEGGGRTRGAKRGGAKFGGLGGLGRKFGPNH
ncbi:hypothetical protein N7G274_007927 [Stereocaulon virgatum]|uniref:PCI domain-containing protein n=1 Tax=Stereocaulon virgatum TaxID=373712 RepID=A0ABR4A3G0_9LECA